MSSITAGNTPVARPFDVPRMSAAIWAVDRRMTGTLFAAP
jgi:hypothetical protein